MRKLVDLHFHSTYSDGSENVRSIIEKAKNEGLVALALTDHYTGKGVHEFVTACRESQIIPLEGVEIHIAFPDEPWSWDSVFCGPVPDAVILGRKLDWKMFQEEYQKILAEYWLNYWLPETLEKFRQAGMKVPELTRDELKMQMEESVIPRCLHDVQKNPENFQRLWEICQSCGSDADLEKIVQNPVAFANRYMNNIGGQAYVLRAPREFTIKRISDLAKAMGGVLFAAHPAGIFHCWSQQHLDYFAEQGGGGIEAYQYWHTEEQIKELLNFAKKHQLMVSGGSDWHGKNGMSVFACYDRPKNQMPFSDFIDLLRQLP